MTGCQSALSLFVGLLLIVRVRTVVRAVVGTVVTGLFVILIAGLVILSLLIITGLLVISAGLLIITSLLVVASVVVIAIAVARGRVWVVDKVNVLANVGIDTGVSRSGAVDAPRHDTNQSAVVIDDWATAVALARVLARGTGAEHVLGDLSVVLVVRRVAILTRDDGNRDLAQVGRHGRVGRLEQTPAGNGGGGVGLRVGSRRGEGNVLDGIVVLLDGLGQGPDGNVVVHGIGRVLGVNCDLADIDLLAALCPRL